MGANVWFWIIYVFSILFGCGMFYIGRPGEADAQGKRVFGGWVGSSLIFYLLIGLLGVRVFGWPVQ